MAKLRAGLLGYGSMGRNHARVLIGLPEVELVSIADPRTSGQIVNGIEIRDSFAEVLDQGVDYVVVAAPTSHHLSLAIQACEAGAHLLVEKPVAPTSTEAAEMVEKFEAAGLIAAVGHIERFNPAVRMARDLLEAGHLGATRQIATRRQGPYPGRISDVGVALDLATHDVDLTMWLGAADYCSVTAVSSSETGGQHEDLLLGIGLLTNGVCVSHTVNWISPFKDRTVTVVGEAGALQADTTETSLTFFENRVSLADAPEIPQFRGVQLGDVVKLLVPRVEPLVAEHEAFRDQLLGRSADSVSLREGLAAIRVVEALKESAQSGSAYEVDGRRSQRRSGGRAV